MKSILCLAICFAFASCSLKIIPLKGVYPTPPVQQVVNKNFDDTWSALVDVFASKNIPIKIIDKSSGLIVSERISMNTTYENKDGSLKVPGAFIVVPAYYDAGSRRTTTFYLSDSYVGEFNIRVKKAENGTLVIVNLSGLQGKKIGNNELEIVKSGDFHTTGNFEKSFFELLK